MKNNKGFTLAELLGVIVIISIILLLVIIPSTNQIKKGSDLISDSQSKLIKLGVENWMSDNKSMLPQNDGESITLTTGMLKQEGLLEMDLKDPTTGECIPNNTEITILRVNGKYEISIDYDSGTDECTDVDKNGPIIYLNGDSLMYVEFGSTFTDPGASAKTSMGVPITTINSQVTKGGTSINTSKFAQYEITYIATDNGITASTKRTVIITDSTAPVITVPADSVISSDVKSINLMTGVSATDLADGNLTSKIKVTGTVTPEVLGTYIIKYEVTDNSGNTATVYRKITIKDTTKPTTTIEVLNNPFNSENWAKTNIEVKIRVTDKGGSGPAGFKVCQSKTGECTPTTVKNEIIKDFTISDESATNYICVIPFDYSGNEGPRQCYGPYKLDKTAPNCTNSGDNSSWTKNDVTIYWGCSDSLSTCNSSYSGGNKTYNTTTSTANIKSYEIRDKAGNSKTCSSRTANVYVDKIPPTCTNSGDNSSWTKNDVTIYWGCSDSDSKCNTSYSGGSKTYNTTTSTASIGSYEIRDNAGNSTTCTSRTANVYVDKTPPTCINSGDNSSWTTNNVTIYWGCSDSDSKCNSSYSGGNKTFSTTTSTASIGSYEIRDNVGNSTTCSSRTANVYIDKTGPYYSSGGSVSKGSVSTASYGDNESGVQAVYYYISESSTTPQDNFTGTSRDIPTTGGKTYYVWSRAIDWKNNSSGVRYLGSVTNEQNSYQNSYDSNGGYAQSVWKNHINMHISSVSGPASAVSISGNISTGYSWLYNNYDYWRNVCLTNHHNNNTGSGYCVSSNQQIRGTAMGSDPGPYWRSDTTYDWSVTLSISNPSGCYDVMIYGPYSNDHLTSIVQNAVCF